MAETQWMTLLETADLMKQLPDQVTRMCVEGKLEYYLEDGRYFVSRESIDLFMHSRTGEPPPESPDSNGAPRRQYGRAPVHTEPLTESAHETATVYGRDEAGTAETADDAEVVTNGDIADEAPAAEVEASVARDESETAETADDAEVETRADIEDETHGQDDEDIQVGEAVDTDSFSGVAEPDGQDAPGVRADLTDEPGQESVSAPESAKGYADEGLAFSEGDETGATEEDVVSGEDEENVLARVDENDAVAQVDENDAVAQVHENDAVAQVDEVDPSARATEDDAEAGEDMEDTAAREVEEDTAAREVEELASSTMDPVDPGAKTVEILADLRAALARHALEHKAFCDEIAGLADALESTLSRSDDKTSELTREISSLLARYTRR